MKKSICLIIAICLVAALAGCARRGDSQLPDSESTAPETSQTNPSETEETPVHNTGDVEMDFSDFE